MNVFKCNSMQPGVNHAESDGGVLRSGQRHCASERPRDIKATKGSQGAIAHATIST